MRRLRDIIYAHQADLGGEPDLSEGPEGNHSSRRAVAASTRNDGADIAYLAAERAYEAAAQAWSAESTITGGV
jgi:hypothetical protein